MIAALRWRREIKSSVQSVARSVLVLQYFALCFLINIKLNLFAAYKIKGDDYETKACCLADLYAGNTGGVRGNLGLLYSNAS